MAILPIDQSPGSPNRPTVPLSREKIRKTVVSKTSAYTAGYNELILCTGTFVITLPNIASTDIAKEITICSITGTITLTPDGADTIHGETSQSARTGDTFNLSATTTSTWRAV